MRCALDHCVLVAQQGRERGLEEVWVNAMSLLDLALLMQNHIFIFIKKVILLGCRLFNIVVVKLRIPSSLNLTKKQKRV